MSRIRCSQCGQEGHNRRNRNCPVNSNQIIPETSAIPFTHTIMTPEITEMINQCRTRLLTAIEDLTLLAQLINRPDALPPIEYVVAVVLKTNLFCTNINLALECDLVTTPLISQDHIFEMLSQHIYNFNVILELIIQTPTRLVVSLQNNRFSSSLNTIVPALEKSTSAYFKEIPLINDLTIAEDAPSCECPLCFDEFAATDVLVTNCNHSFCGTCVKEYATINKNKIKKPDCPMCRADITEFKIGNPQVHNDISNHILNL